jgi:copper transport protein
MRRWLIAGLAAATLWLLLGSGALAHSVLLSSTPAAGAQLASPPASVQMTFSEGVAPDFSSFAVIDRARRHYESAQPPVIDAQKGLVTVALQPNLPSGVYIVQWKVVSVIDGHLTRGSFAFTVQGGAPPAGDETPTPAAGGTAGGVGPAATPQPTVNLPPDDNEAAATTSEFTLPGPPDVFVRWLTGLLPAIIIGAAVFRLLVVPAGLAHVREARAALLARLDLRLVMVALVSAWVLLMALGAELLLQAMRVTESDALTVLAQHNVLSNVLGTSFGLSLELRALGALTIFALLVVGLATGRVRGVIWGLVVALGVAYFVAATGSAHATALSETRGAGWLQAIAPAANVVHLFITAVWIGGIFSFVGILLPAIRGLAPENRAAVLRDSIARFSLVGLVSVPLVALSGTLLYLAADPSVATTLDTDYGRVVLAKVALLAVLLIPAAYNLRRVGPGLARLRGAMGSALGRLVAGFQQSIRAEAVLVSVAVVCAALLTLLAPATDPAALARTAPPASKEATTVAEAAPPTATAAPLPTEPVSTTLTLSQTVQGVDLALTTEHSVVDNLSVALHDAHGAITACAPTPAPDANCVLSVKLTVTQLDDNTSFSEVAPDTGGGRFAVPEGPYLALDGNWQIVVVVRRYNQPKDLKAAFRYSVTGTALTGRPSDFVNVDVTTQPNPPKSGPVDFVFHLTDNNDRPITDATVTMQGIMPTHGHVTELTPLANAQGTYTGHLLMPMSGGWAVDLTIARPGHDTLVAEVDLDLDKSDYDLTPYPTPNITPAP